MVEIVPNLKMDALNLISVSISQCLCFIICEKEKDNFLRYDKIGHMNLISLTNNDREILAHLPHK